MSARSKARKQALDILFESDIRGSVALDILVSRDVVEEGPDARPIREYTREIISGVSEHRRKIDELIATCVFLQAQEITHFDVNAHSIRFYCNSKPIRISIHKKNNTIPCYVSVSVQYE